MAEAVTEGGPPVVVAEDGECSAGGVAAAGKLMTLKTALGGGGGGGKGGLGRLIWNGDGAAQSVGLSTPLRLDSLVHARVF